MFEVGDILERTDGSGWQYYVIADGASVVRDEPNISVLYLERANRIPHMFVKVGTYL